MTLKTRRILYITFILIFCISTPLVIFYALGYKIGTGFNVQKTGALILDSNPSGAKVYLNGKLQQKLISKILSNQEDYFTTPIKIKNLLPGEYDVRLELEGNWTWEKKLKVNPGQSTFAETINLFKKDLPALIKQGSFEKISFSADKKNLVALGKDSIYFINIDTEEIKTLQDKNFTFSDKTACLWSANDKKIIIDNKIFSLEEIEKYKDLGQIIGKQVSNVKWGDNDNEIFYSGKDSISSYSLSSNLNKTVVEKIQLSDYLYKNGALYIVEQNKLAASLNFWSIGENKSLRKINLPAATYNFINPEHKLVNLYDTDHRILFLIDQQSIIKPIKETINNVNKTFWVNENKLLYSTNFELWIMELDNPDKLLLTRISDEIKDILWHPSNNYIIYSTDKNINIIELDEREKRSVTEIFKTEKISYLNLNSKGDLLFFYGNLGNQQGIYKLLIQ